MNINKYIVISNAGSPYGGFVNSSGGTVETNNYTMNTELYNEAELVLIPSGYKDSKLYSQKPLNANGIWTFSRSTFGTRFNNDNELEEKGANIPRLDHSGDQPVLLIEPTSTNEVLSSTAAPTPNGVTVSSDGTFKGEPVFKCEYPSGGNGDRIIYINTSISGTVSNSIWIKANKESDIKIGHNIGGGSESKEVDINTEWQRIEVQNYLPSNNSSLFITRRDGYTETDAITVWVSMPQVEQSPYCTSYIITDGSATTRNADQFYIHDLYSKNILQDTGWFTFETSNQLFENIEGQANAFTLKNKDDGNKYLRFRYNNDTLFFQNIGFSGSNTDNIDSYKTNKKWLIYWDNNDLYLYGSGEEIHHEVIGSSCQIGDLNIGNDAIVKLRYAALGNNTLTVDQRKKFTQ